MRARLPPEGRHCSSGVILPTWIILRSFLDALLVDVLSRCCPYSINTDAQRSVLESGHFRSHRQADLGEVVTRCVIQL